MWWRHPGRRRGVPEVRVFGTEGLGMWDVDWVSVATVVAAVLAFVAVLVGALVLAAVVFS